MIVQTDGLGFSKDELSIKQLPPIPAKFQKKIAQFGGNSNGKPNARIVSGLDESIVDFYGGRVWRRYSFIEHYNSVVSVLHKPDGTKEYYDPKEANKLKGKVDGVFLEDIRETIVEHGIPRYIMEIYKPPQMYGSPEAWEEHRYVDADDPQNITGERMDMLGPFPTNGRYEEWFLIEDLVIDDKDGNVTKTQFRALDDEVLEFIRLKIIQARKLQMEQHKEMVEKAKIAKKKHRDTTLDAVRASLSDNYRRLTGGIQTTGMDINKNEKEKPSGKTEK